MSLTHQTMKYYIKGLSTSKERSSSSSDTDTAGTPSYTNWNYRKLRLHVTLGHVWNRGLKYSSLKQDGGASTEARLVPLMLGNCLNLSGYGTGPHAACSAKRGKNKKTVVALSSSGSSVLIQSNMGLEGKPQWFHVHLGEPVLGTMITDHKLIMMTV